MSSEGLEAKGKGGEPPALASPEVERGDDSSKQRSAQEEALRLVDVGPRQTPEDFVELVHRSRRTVRSLAFRLLGDRGLMEDALQEAYLNAYQAWGAFRGRACDSTWLYRIVYNACIDELRRPGRRRLVSLDCCRAHASGGPDPAETAALRSDLATALLDLPASDRGALLLVDAEGLTYREAAEVLGVPAGTVASRVARSRRRLREVLRPGESAPHGKAGEEPWR